MQTQACDSCHRRKSRCDKSVPCGYCQKAQVECVYTDRSKEPALRRQHVVAIERRLRHAEAKNKALVAELAKAKDKTNISRTPKFAPYSYSGGGSGGNLSESLTPRSISASAAGDADGNNGDNHTHLQSTVSGDTLVSEDVMSEVTFLASTAAGERHYLGSTSGVLFANLVRASVEISSSHPPSSTIEGNGQQQLSFSTARTSATSETLPPQDLAKELVTSYLSHEHLCYPFLQPQALLSIVESVYHDPSFYKNNAFESFVFDLVLAIATASVYKFDWQMLPSAETHHLRAMSRITEVFQTGGIKSLQAILLLCQYRTGSSMQDTSASMWHLVGIAVRICFELGLHRESVYTIQDRNPESAAYLGALREHETRRRCFWCVFAMDRYAHILISLHRWQDLSPSAFSRVITGNWRSGYFERKVEADPVRIVGITLGRPLSISLDDIDVRLPLVENNHIFSTPLEGIEDPPVVSRTAIFVHITEYRLLSGRIMKSLHAVKRPEHDESQICALRDGLVGDLDRWREKTKELGIPDVDLHSKMMHDRSSFRSNEWYEVLTNNAMLFLFRPSPMLSDITKDSGSLQIIFSSSKQAISLYAYLHRSRKINYSWITLHSVFMAGLSYIYAVSRHFRERRRGRAISLLKLDPSTIEIVNDTRACSNVLVAVSERWNSLRSCHEVFDRLSDAILEDAITLQCTSIASQQFLIARQPIIGQTHDHSSSSAPDGTTIGTDGVLPMNPDIYPAPSPLAVDSEFRNCFENLQNLYEYNQSYVTDPVMQLSQDWLSYINDFDGMITPMTSDQYIGTANQRETFTFSRSSNHDL